MSDKLNATLDELIEKEKDKKTSKKGKGKGKMNKQRQKSNKKNAPSARDKAKRLRKQKVNKFGGARRDDEPTEGRRKLVSRSRRLREQRDFDDRKPKLSKKLKVLNLNNSISNEDLNVLFSNIGTLTG